MFRVGMDSEKPYTPFDHDFCVDRVKDLNFLLSFSFILK